MGPSRTSRKKVVTISSDEDDENVKQEAKNIDDEPSKVQTRSTGKLKPIKKTTKTQQSGLKASPRKPASKATPKELPKPDGKPIYSFFNAATQRQRSSQRSASPIKSPTVPDELEQIHDESDKEDRPGHAALTTLSKGSSTAMAMRKRKFQSSPGTENDSKFQQPSASQKFMKAGGGERVPSVSLPREDKRPWTEQFAPVDLIELAVHKRKVADVRQWLDITFQGRRQKVLVLKGAAGTGKTTTISLLAQELGLDLVEWKDAIVSDHTIDDYVSTATRFEEFVGRAGRLSGLQLSTDADTHPAPITTADSVCEESRPRRKALLLEDFPNTFSRTSSTLQSFRSTLAQYLSSPVPSGATPTPIVMVISETLLSTNTAAADSFTAHRLLGPELITNPYVNVIEFNPVAPTYLTKALELIVVKEARKSGRRKTPGPLVLKQLCETGDIRSAVSSLEFLCLRGDEGDTWSRRVAFTKPKQAKTQTALSKGEAEALKLISNRESTLGIFHSVGKIMYNKRTDPQDSRSLMQPAPWLSQHRRTKVPETDVDALIDELGTDTSTFVAALHENYTLSCASSSAEEALNSLSGSMDNLSDSDLLSLDRFSFGTRAFSGSTTDSLRQDEMCFQVAVRGLLFSLPCPVHRSAPAGGRQADAFRMFYPASLKLWRKTEEMEGRLTVLAARLSAGKRDAGQHSRESNSATGVETWKRNTSLGNGRAATTQADLLETCGLSAELKAEMLTDRLPYLAHIYASRKASAAAQSLVDDVRSITRISGDALNLNEDEADADDDAEVAAVPEQWTTDHPDGEQPPKARNRTSTTKAGKTAFDAKGLSLPVETRVETLVLEDDDIVDD